MNHAHYFSLGATLYTPCTHVRLASIMARGLGSKSMVFCTEDAVSDSDLAASLNNLRNALTLLDVGADTALKRFVRPRNAQVLAEILRFDGIEKIDGFVLPKYDLGTLHDYHQVLATHAKAFLVMPTLESLDVMNPHKLPLLRQHLDEIKSRVICLRIGGNDLFNLLGIKRMPNQTIYDTPLRAVIEQLVIAFRPYGYELTAPVFDLLEDRQTLERELRIDLNYGFFGKTAIHPTQVNVIERYYQDYSHIHLQQAESVLAEQAPAVYQLNGQMMETACHTNWAQRTKILASSF